MTMLEDFQNDFYIVCEINAIMMLLFSLKMEQEWLISARVKSELQLEKTT